MTAQPAVDTTWAFLEEAHDKATDALDADLHLDAVVWLSAHLAAVRRTVHRAAAGDPRAARLRAADRRLEQLLRRVEQHYSGDGLAVRLDEGGLDVALRRALDEHCRAERVVAESLVRRLDRKDVADLIGDYGDALTHAPTRPHPHAPNRGLLGALAFRVDAWRDRILDTMDARHVPTPRVSRRPPPPGRWGRYVLGEMER